MLIWFIKEVMEMKTVVKVCFIVLLMILLLDGGKTIMASSTQSLGEEEMKFLTYVLRNSPHLFMGVCKVLFSKDRCISCSIHSFNLKACLIQK